LKKIISILLLLVLTAPVAGTYLWLQLKKQVIKKEIKWKMIDGIDRNELVLLSFTVKESETLLRWKHAREFEFRGEMYDIAEVITKGDSVFYYCWWDHEETALNIKLNSLVAHAAGKSTQSQDKVKQVIQFFKSLYFNEFRIDDAPPQTTCISKNFHYTFIVKTSGNSPPAPPPKEVHGS